MLKNGTGDKKSLPRPDHFSYAHYPLLSKILNGRIMFNGCLRQAILSHLPNAKYNT